MKLKQVAILEVSVLN